MNTHMPKSNGSRSTNLKGLAAMAAIPAMAAALVAGDAAAERKLDTACTGTYVIRESNGAVELWTIHRDGTLISTSSGERAGNFSTQHGTWKGMGPLTARAIQLGFHWTAEGGFASIRRIDIDIRGENGACDTIVGDAVGRLFEAEESFSNPGTDSGAPFEFTFSGSRVEVSL